jgi:hypothetical protein
VGKRREHHDFWPVGVFWDGDTKSTVKGNPMSRIRGALVLAAIASLVLASGALAARVTGGTTTITASSATTTLLSNNNITVTPIAPATASGTGALTFPITHGRLNTKTLHGRLVQSGGLKLTNGTKTVVLRHLEIVSTKRGAAVWALVRGESRRFCRHLHRFGRRGACAFVTRYRVAPIARITSGSVSGSSFTGTLAITQAAANVVDRLAGSKVVAAGATLGTISIAPTLS